MDDIINTVVSNYESTYIMSNKANKSQEKIQIDQKTIELIEHSLTKREDQEVWIALWDGKQITCDSNKSSWVSLVAAKNAINHQLWNISRELDCDSSDIVKTLQSMGRLEFKRIYS